MLLVRESLSERFTHCLERDRGRDMYSIPSILGELIGAMTLSDEQILS